MGTIRLFNHYINKITVVLMAAEMSSWIAAMYLGVYARFIREPADIATVEPIWLKAAAFAVVMAVCQVVTGLYNPRLRDRFRGVLVRIIVAFVLSTTVMTLAFYLIPALYLGRGAFAAGLLIAFIFTLIIRGVFLGYYYRTHPRRRVLVLGAGKRVAPLTQLRRRSDLLGAVIVGYVRVAADEPTIPENRIIGTADQLADLVRRYDVDQVIVALDDGRAQLPIKALIHSRTDGVEITDLVSFLEQETGRIKLDVMYPSWLIYSPGFRQGSLREAVKRFFDVATSLLMLIAVFPVMLLTALLIWIESGFQGPVLYRQVRVGQSGRPFELLKFRSMRTDAEQDGKARWASAGDNRVTRVGRVIRKYRIDELPQIYNVLRGEMSFVGPRPERPEFADGLSSRLPYYSERHQVKPGLTGWAQVCYPYGASEEDAFEKLQYDLYYVKNHSLFMDLMIIMQTAEVVFLGRGAR